jgi:acetyl esterase/lipase
VADLVAYVRKNAGDFGVDRDRIAIWAFSGGGPFLARWIAEPPAYLRALVGYYAVLDVREPMGSGPDKLGRDVRVKLSRSLVNLLDPRALVHCIQDFLRTALRA